MLDGLVGAGLALLAATGFAFQYLCIRIGTDEGTVNDAVLVTLCCNVGLLVPLVLVRYWGELSGLFTPTALTGFAGAGIVGSFLARICMYRGVETIGASRTSPIVSANVLFATVFAVVLLGERLVAAHVVGILLIVGGVGILSWETARVRAQPTGPDNVGLGLAYPVAAALLIGVEPILLSVGLDQGTPMLAGLAVMLSAALFGFLGYWTLAGNTLDVSRSDPELRWYLAAGVASTVAFVAYLLGLQHSDVVVVVPIMQTNPLIVLLVSAAFLPARLERVTWRLVASAAVVVIGAAVVALGG